MHDISLETRDDPEEALQESDDRLHALYRAPAMLHSIDASGRIVGVSDHWLEVLGYDRDEVIGRRSLDFLTEESRQHATTVTLPAFMQTGYAKDVPYQFVKKNGEIIDVLLSAVVQRDADGVYERSLAVLSDVTERNRAELQLRNVVARLQSLLEIERAILAAQSPEDIGQAALDQLSQLLPHARASVVLFDLLAEQAEVFAIRVDGETSISAGSRFALDDYEVPQALRNGDVHIVDDISGFSDSSVHRKLLAEGMRSYINIPLAPRGQLIGALNIAAVSPKSFSPEHIEIARQVADQLAIAVSQARLFEQVQRDSAELEHRVEKRTTDLRIANERLQREINERRRTEQALADEVRGTYSYDKVIGKSKGLQDVMRKVELVANTDTTVLVVGETGTGKELICRAIHQMSQRNSKPLIKLNCAAIPSGLIESELFGHEKGAFTGAFARKQGRFQLAHEGTIFLDEIGDLPLETQAKLLRVLQEQEFELVGGTRTIKADVRIVAATHRNLEQMVNDGQFRKDLFFRLNVFPVNVPPLRDRTEDIPLLASFIARQKCARLGLPPADFSEEVIERLNSYAWPGNVREMENLVERSVILSGGGRIEEEHIQLEDHRLTPDEHRLLPLHELERRHILAALKATNGKVSGKGGAAALLGLKPTTLEARMKKLAVKRGVS